MPQAFDNCVKRGGKVWTKSYGNGTYRHFCTIGGATHAGHLKHKKTHTRPRRRS